MKNSTASVQQGRPTFPNETNRLIGRENLKLGMVIRRRTRIDRASTEVAIITREPYQDPKCWNPRIWWVDINGYKNPVGDLGVAPYETGPTGAPDRWNACNWTELVAESSDELEP